MRRGGGRTSGRLGEAASNADPARFGERTLDYVADAAAAFEAAADAAGGAIERSHRIAGLTVTLRFAGPSLVEQLSAALEHHPDGAAPGPRLTVSIWDTRSSGTPLPRFPAGAVDGGTTGGSRVGGAPAIRARYGPRVPMLSMLDRRRDAAVFCVPDGAHLPYWEMGAPLRVILHWWMADHGRQLVHAAALGTPGGGVLVAGRAGSGKSTTALACVGSSLGYGGDDYCLVGLDPEPTAYSLYGSAKLDADQVGRFPHLAPALVDGGKLDGEKALFLIHRARPDCIQHAFPIRAVVVPVISGGHASRLEPTSAGTALRALAPSTILQLPGAGAGALATATRLVRQVPAYVLHLGRDLEGVPSALAALLAGIGER